MLLATTRGTDSVLQFITVLLLFFFVLLITWVTVRIIARWQKGQTAGGNIEIIETRSVGNNKFLAIVRVGSRYLLVALGKDEVNMLTELDPDDLVPGKEETEAPSFASILDKVKNLKK
ncbi:MAG: flagellar biosynthetic protein FliO [Lachnospiraceae bacterium]|nr:flagellar biosynthetic protein FliO [Lachnospiraceae bacterium]